MVVGDELPSPEPLGALQMSRGTNNRAYEFETPDMLVLWPLFLIPAAAQNVQLKGNLNWISYLKLILYLNNCEMLFHETHNWSASLELKQKKDVFTF